MTELVLALLAGMLTVASPCVLPILPMVLGSSIGPAHPLRPLSIVLGFVVTFAALGIALGAWSSSLGAAHGTIRNVAILTLLLTGLMRLWPQPYDRLMARFGGVWNRFADIGSRTGSGLAGGVVLGMTLGVVWTPCAGPVLASILALVAKAQDLDRAAALLAAFAVGAGVPMLLIAHGGRFMSTRVRQLARHTHRLQQGFGVAVILIAIAMYYQYDVLAVAWLTDFFPTFSTITTGA